MEYQIVISRYNEDISYLSFFKDIILVYNKGDAIDETYNIVKLPNIGRESHTYIYHIVNNYENLANRTLFIQGNVTDHKLLPTIEYFKKNDFIANLKEYNIDSLKSRIKHSFKFLKALKSGDLKKSKYTPYIWINKIGIDISDLNRFKMTWGANFCVSKELIHKRPKIFYEHLLKYIEYDQNPEEGHFFERSWYLIFNNPKFIEKKIIYYNFDPNITIESLNYYKNLFKEVHLWTNNIDNITNINLKYINSEDYININLNIINNTFEIELNILNILLSFDNNINFEIKFGINNIEIFHNDIFLINATKNNYMEKYTIMWYNNLLLIIKNNIVILHILNELSDKLNFTSSKIQGNNQYFNHKYNNDTIYIFYTNSSYMNKIFYKDNYEDYYVKELEK